MKVGFDLDGCLDKPAIAELAKKLINDGVEVHIITGNFPEAGNWQQSEAKCAKLDRLGIRYFDPSKTQSLHLNYAHLHIISAMPETYSRDYRLADIGMRKGELCERLGITLMFDDSDLYCDMIPKMAGATTILHVRH